MALWTIADQQQFRPLGKNSTELFKQLQVEVETNDVVLYLGFEFYQDLKRNLADYELLINGGSYELNGYTYEFDGLKKMFSFLLYARYVRQSYITDTFSGFSQHTGENFQRISNAELSNQENMYKQIAGTVWDGCYRYLATLQLPYFHFAPNTKRTFKIDAL